MAEVYILETFHLGISIFAKGTVKMYVCWYTLFTVFQLQQDIESMATLDFQTIMEIHVVLIYLNPGM